MANRNTKYARNRGYSDYKRMKTPGERMNYGSAHLTRARLAKAKK